MKKKILCLAVMVLINTPILKTGGAGADENNRQIILNCDGGVLLNNLADTSETQGLKAKIEKRQTKKITTNMDQSAYDLEVITEMLRTFKHNENDIDLIKLGLAKTVETIRRNHLRQLVAREKEHPGSVPEFADLPPHTLTQALREHTELPAETIQFIQEKANAVFISNLERGVQIAAGTHAFALLEHAAQSFHRLPRAIQDMLREKAGISSNASARAERPKKEGSERWVTTRKAITFGSGIAASAAASAGLIIIKNWFKF